MFKISHKAAYQLIGRFYTRKSVKAFTNGEVDEAVLNSSFVFALQNEDYEYLETFTKKLDQLDSSYYIFYDGINEKAIVLEKNRDFTVIEFAILSLKCTKIAPEEFETILIGLAESNYLNEAQVTKELESFRFARKMIAQAH